MIMTIVLYPNSMSMIECNELLHQYERYVNKLSLYELAFNFYVTHSNILVSGGMRN